MKRWCMLAVVCVAIGCGGDNNMVGGGPEDGGEQFPDGHLQAGCQTAADCDDGNKCHTPICSAGTCQNQTVSCPAPDDCNVGSCDPSSGMCGTMAANEGKPCTSSSSGMPGSCTSGYCQPLPTCYDSTSDFNSLSCGGTPVDDSTDSATAINPPTNVMSSYACATNETGPEVAYAFTVATDGPVTVSLKSSADSAIDGGAADPDLDLIILDGSCTASAACVNPANASGGGYQGITAGTGKEKVTFQAMASHSYYIVVDGKNGAIGNYHLSVDSCGACNAATAPVLSCNMSMPVAADTAKGQSQLSMYSCTSGTSTQMVSAPGNEVPFLFSTTAPITVHATAQVVNATAPVTLLALPTNLGACDPTMCAGSATTTGTAPKLGATLSFDAAPDFSNNVNYWVVVDSPSTTSNATFGVQLSCKPFCNYNFDSVDCSTKAAPSGANNGQSGSTNDVSAWGPAGAACGGMTNLSGPEYVYLFHKQATTNLPKYRLTLAALDQKHLGLVVLDAGKTDPTASCDPTLACANTAAVTVAATATTLASTGSYVSAGPGTADGGANGKTAVVDLTTGTTGEHYYWVVVDGVSGDTSNFALSIDSGCP